MAKKIQKLKIQIRKKYTARARRPRAAARARKNKEKIQITRAAPVRVQRLPERELVAAVDEAVAAALSDREHAEASGAAYNRGSSRKLVRESERASERQSFREQSVRE